MRVLRIRPRLGGILEAIVHVSQTPIVVIVLVLLLLGVVVPIGHRLVGPATESVKKFFPTPQGCEKSARRRE